MVTHWKSLALALIGLAAIAWSLRSDIGASLGSEVAAQMPAAAGCYSRHSTRCTVEIRYAPAADLISILPADLSVVPQDVYF
jgi:hypothetical protein